MKLDSMIKEGKRPLTCIDVEQAREFVGKECIFSDYYDNYQDIRKYDIESHNKYTGILSMDDEKKWGDYVFKNTKNKSRYRLILPCEWVQPPKTPEFVPYTLDTWQHEFEPGDVIIFRGKVGTDRDGIQYKCIYAGWRQDFLNYVIILGLWGFTFKELSELYEIYRDNTWEPFGRKVEKDAAGQIKQEEEESEEAEEE